jgi:hypothetical protein
LYAKGKVLSEKAKGKTQNTPIKITKIEVIKVNQHFHKKLIMFRSVFILKFKGTKAIVFPYLKKEEIKEFLTL